MILDLISIDKQIFDVHCKQHITHSFCDLLNVLGLIKSSIPYI